MADSEFLVRTMVGVGLLSGSANVIMQLSRPGVGYGVFESTVESGQIHRHPLKRTRTTLSYLAVAGMGDDATKAAFRAATNRSHAAVRSNASSPVSYSAFDHDLQLWVAACLYRGFEDIGRAIYGSNLEVTDEMYEQCHVLGTTLQMPRQLWPADRAAFETYWEAALDDVHIDPTIREYLYGIASTTFVKPKFVHPMLSPFARFMTTGFLPTRFREEMGLPWDDRKQKRFDRFMSILGRLNAAMPRVVQQFPFNYLLWDVRRRMASGRPLV